MKNPFGSAAHAEQTPPAQPEQPSWLRAARIGATAFFAVAFAVVFGLYFAALSTLRTQTAEDLRRLARAASISVDGDSFRQVAGKTSGASAMRGLERMAEAIRRGADSLEAVRFISTYVVAAEKPERLVRVTPGSDPEPAQLEPGTEPAELDPATSALILTVYQERQPAADPAPRRREGEEAQCGYAPIIDRHDQVVGVMEIGMDAGAYRVRRGGVQRALLLELFFLLAGCGLTAQVLHRAQSDFERVHDTAGRAASLLQILAGELVTGVLVENDAKEILFINQQLCSLVGIPLQPERLWQRHSNLVMNHIQSVAVPPAEFSALLDHIRHGGHTGFEHELVLQDGRALSWDYAPVSLGGGRKGHLWKFSALSPHPENAPEPAVERFEDSPATPRPETPILQPDADTAASESAPRLQA